MLDVWEWVKSANERQIPCVAIGTALLCDLRPTFNILVVDISFLVDICRRFGVDRVLDFQSIPRW